jgi:hypothetical protein
VTYSLLEETEILQYCFYVLDREKVSVCTLPSAAAVWHACSPPRALLLQLCANTLSTLPPAVHLHTALQNGYVAMEELKMLIDMLYSIEATDGGPSGNTRVALQKLPVQADGKVEFWEFKLFHDAFPSLFYPAFRLQVKVSCCSCANTVSIVLLLLAVVLQALLQATAACLQCHKLCRRAGLQHCCGL